MPYLKLQTNQELADETALLKKLSAKLAAELGKPETYIMTALESNLSLTFAGSTEPAAFVELKSIGLEETATSQLSAVICDFISTELEISPDRIYIEFASVSGSMWGWKGSTF